MSTAVLLIAALLSLLPIIVTAQSSSSITWYWYYQLVNNTAQNIQYLDLDFTHTVCASGTLVTGPDIGGGVYVLQSITGQRIFSTAAGSTLQNVIGVNNYAYGGDNFIYSTAPYIDADGLSIDLDSNVLFANGPWFSNNLSLSSGASELELFSFWSITTTGFVVSATAPPSPICTLTAPIIWSWSYLISGTSNGNAFTVCAAGYVTTGLITTRNGQSAYAVQSINGTRQLTIGSNVGPNGNNQLQNIVGLSSANSASNYIYVSSSGVPSLDTNGLSFTLNGNALTPTGTATSSIVTITAASSSSSSYTESSTLSSPTVTSSSFTFSNSPVIPECPAQQLWSFCYYMTSPSTNDIINTYGTYSVITSGTFTTSLAVINSQNSQVTNDIYYLNNGPYYIIHSLNATRIQTSIQGILTGSLTLVSLNNTVTSFDFDNRIYTTFPYIDQYGLLLNINPPQPLVGQWIPSNIINLCEDLPEEIGFPSYSEIPYDSSYFIYQSMSSSQSTPVTCPAPELTQQFIINYILFPSPITAASFQICTTILINTIGPFPTTTSGRYAYTLTSVATGTRTVWDNNINIIQNINSISADIGDLQIFNTSPYMNIGGGFSFLFNNTNNPQYGLDNFVTITYDGTNYYEYTLPTYSTSTLTVTPYNGGALPTTCAVQPTTYTWQYTITNGSNVFGQWSVCASGTITVSPFLIPASVTPLGFPAYYAIGATGTRTFTGVNGSTVQQIVGLLGNFNQNLDADNLLYIIGNGNTYTTDGNGIALQTDTPVIWANGAFQYANLSLWGTNPKLESYAPEGISSGLQYSTSTTVPTCAQTAPIVWTWYYYITGTASGSAYTVCAAGLLTTSAANNGMYTVLSAQGTRQVSIGNNFNPAGNNRAQNVTGIVSASSSPISLTSTGGVTGNGLVFQLDSAVILPTAATSSATTVTVVPSSASAGVPLTESVLSSTTVTSSQPFQITQSQTIPQCPAQQAFTFCHVMYSPASNDPDSAEAPGPWAVVTSGTFSTGFGTQTGGNHPNSRAYTLPAQYYVLTNIAGTRVQYNPDGSVTTSGISGLAGTSIDNLYLADNRIYTTYPYLDEYGWVYLLDSPVTVPGGYYGNEINLCEAAPIEASTAQPSWSYLTFQPYAGGLIPQCPVFGSFSTISFAYTISSGSTTTNVNAQLRVLGPYNTVVPGRYAYVVTNATGTRTFTAANGQVTTSTIIGAGQDVGDSTIYSNQPFILQDGGFSLVFAAPAPTAAGLTVTAVNIVNNLPSGPAFAESVGGVVTAINPATTTVTISRGQSSTSTTSTSGGGGGSGLSDGAIAGIVIGSIVGALLLCILLAIIFLIASGKRSDKRSSSATSATTSKSVVPPESSVNALTHPYAKSGEETTDAPSVSRTDVELQETA